jgi:diguanylate cyclase (GGDEF)-like protein
MKPKELSGVLTEFAQVMVTDFPIQEILDHLAERIVEVMPVTAAGVTLITPELKPRYIAASDNAALLYEKLQTQMGEGPCIVAYQTGQAVSVPDLRHETRFPTFVPPALAAGLAAVFTVPLRHGATRLGALDLYRDRPGPLSSSALAAAQTLAEVASAYLINAQARADLLDASAQSRDAALHDALTGLPNRVLMLEMVEHTFRDSRRSGKLSAVLFADLDRFKEVNDTYGHQIGDLLLIAVGQRVTGLLRPGDSVGRLSGDEFLVLCEGLDDPAQADPIAFRLHEELSRPFVLSGIVLQISASIGVAFAGQGNDGAQEVLNDADLAMYRNKRKRAGSDPVLDLRDLHLAGYQAGLVRGLPGAIQRHEMHLDYQPIVQTTDGRLTGVEALLRWTHPARGPVAPDVFIPIAEHSGQILELGRWVLEQACSDRERWQHGRSEDIAMAINVSPHQFMSPGFAQSVRDALQSTSTRPGLIMLEVTEGVLVRDQHRALLVMDELTEIGVKLALDDFGTGYSSLGYLNVLPIDAIKIDRTFIASLASKSASLTIVTAIIALAHSLGMTTVSEGVETSEQHHQLVTLGADSCQGFYFARPMAAASFELLLQQLPDLANSHLPVVT